MKKEICFFGVPALARGLHNEIRTLIFGWFGGCVMRCMSLGKTLLVSTCTCKHTIPICAIVPCFCRLTMELLQAEAAQAQLQAVEAAPARLQEAAAQVLLRAQLLGQPRATAQRRVQLLRAARLYVSCVWCLFLVVCEVYMRRLWCPVLVVCEVYMRRAMHASCALHA